jgi:hypothetical protein
VLLVVLHVVLWLLLAVLSLLLPVELRSALPWLQPLALLLLLLLLQKQHQMLLLLLLH